MNNKNHGGPRKGAGRKSRMETNNFDQFELDLLVNYLNHRFKEEPIEVYNEAAKDRPLLYLIRWDHQLWMSLSELRTRFGPNARGRLERWFEIAEGQSGRNSALRLHSGVASELYDYLKEKGQLDKLRRDKEGIADSWVGMEEWKRERYRKTEEVAQP